MEPGLLFLEINLFVSKSISIAPLQISKSCRRRLKKKENLRLLKEAGFEGAVNKGFSLSDQPSILLSPDLQDLKPFSVAPPLPKGIEVIAGFNGTGDVLISIDGRATLSMDEIWVVEASCMEKKRML